MRVAVITPYFKESLHVLQQCHDSVCGQSSECLHVMVADGFPRPEVDSWKVDHIVLPRTHGDVGSTPRLIGCYHAIGLGYDAVAFLDSDNWYRHDHLTKLVALIKSGAAFAASNRVICSLDGTVMARCPITDPERFVDTSCMLFSRPAFHLLHNLALMPDYGHVISDRILLHHVKQSGVQRAFESQPTVFYRAGKAGLYRRLGVPIPEGVEPQPDYDSIFESWELDGNAPLR